MHVPFVSAWKDVQFAMCCLWKVMGSGSHRSVTLSHNAQVKRFTADVLRIFKVQTSKQISILDLPTVYG